MDGPPYAQIVADLRARIASGELAPGDRVPSTREITRRWGVAMATATKALGVLRQEGLVHAVRGSGTVVADRRPARPAAPRRSAPADVSLTRERIVAAAVAVADQEGLAGLSMRRVATELGAATMALYRHVVDKDDLVLRMEDAAFAEWQAPPDALPGWRPRLEMAARRLWVLFRRHPWLAPTMSVTRPPPLAGGLPYAEWVLAALDGTGADPATVFTTYLTLLNYVRGTAVNIEPEADAAASTGLSSDEWMQTQEPAMMAILAAGAFPRFERLIASDLEFDLDTLFEYGLQRLLDGFATVLDRVD